jgi:hypothetical protein
MEAALGFRTNLLRIYFKLKIADLQEIRAVFERATVLIHEFFDKFKFYPDYFG